MAFEDLITTWAVAACEEWGYPRQLPEEWFANVRRRLPPGLQAAIIEAVDRGLIRPVEGHRFTLTGLADGKGPYAFFSRSRKEQPAPNWEYFVQAAEYGRVVGAVAPRGLRVDFEDDLMDIAIYEEDALLWCIEVKEQAKDLSPLLAGIREHGRQIDWQTPDRNNDPLRKAKYLARRRPPYFSLVAIGCRLDFGVSHTGVGFTLREDLVPIA